MVPGGVHGPGGDEGGVHGPWGVPSLGVGWVPAPPSGTATAAGGTHPTGMHSC